MEGLFSTIPALLNDQDLPGEVRMAVVEPAWKKAAGETLSRHAVAVELSEKTLRIAVRDMVWKRHLESLSGQMIFRLNSILRSAFVTYLEFFVDEDAVRAALEVEPQMPSADPEFERLAERESGDDLDEAAQKIKDPEMRQLYLGAAANCLARKRRLDPPRFRR